MTKKTTPTKTSTRPPIVTILGHVDHGKTSLVSAIKGQDLTKKEFGGISQHTKAYQVEKEFDGQKKTITLVDTPGHEAFSKMRSRGGRVADLVILVVAADDGVQPQTKEAVAYTREAGVPIIVALNKIDLETAQPDKVKQQLAELDLAPEDWGGKTTVVPVSAKTQAGIPELLEMILLWAATSDELKVGPNDEFSGIVIESHRDARRGPLTTLLVKTGTLRIGEELITTGAVEPGAPAPNSAYGKVKALFLEGKSVKEAGPSTPVEILGFTDLPEVGAIIKEGTKADFEKPTAPTVSRVTVPDDKWTLNVILKADTVGTAQAVEAAVETIELEGFKPSIIASGIGEVTDSDIRLARDTKAQIFAFNTDFALGAEPLAQDLNIAVNRYQIIYQLLKGITDALTERKQEVEGGLKGIGEVIKIFTLPRSGDRVAGTRILVGEVRKGNRVSIVREGQRIHQARVKSIHESKKTLPKAIKGQEVGLLFNPPLGPKVGDMVEVV